MKTETIASFHLGNSYDKDSQFLFCIKGPIITRDMVLKALKTYYDRSEEDLKKILSANWSLDSDQGIEGMGCSMIRQFGPLTLRTEVLYNFE